MDAFREDITTIDHFKYQLMFPRLLFQVSALGKALFIRISFYNDQSNYTFDGWKRTQIDSVLIKKNTSTDYSITLSTEINISYLALRYRIHLP